MSCQVIRILQKNGGSIFFAPIEPKPKIITIFAGYQYGYD